jgi:hypothetical protein
MSNELEFGLIVLGLLILFFACYAPLFACGEWRGGRLWKFLTWLCCTAALVFVTFTLIQWQFGPEAILPPWGLASWVFGPLAIILWGLAWVFEWETRDNANRFAPKTLRAIEERPNAPTGPKVTSKARSLFN